MSTFRYHGVRTVLANSKGVMRLSEAVDATDDDREDVVRQLDGMEERGDVKVFQVGEHVMVRATGDLREETKDRDWPRSDKVGSRGVKGPNWKH